ncbi:MAG: hypothetical protein OEX98_03360 [Nitrosopumilus sp.]|nr:hypothetical protein [Nitrosopumilus sp.]
MTKIVSARIRNKTHTKLIERCNKSCCTINEWLNELIQFHFTGTSEFDFGDDEFEDEEKSNSNSIQQM